MTTVAEQFAEVLATAGIKRIYGIVGDSLNGLTDAIRRQGSPRPDRDACRARRHQFAVRQFSMVTSETTKGFTPTC
jgi:hypothetical protein